MDSATKKTLVILLAIFIIVVCFMFVFPTNSELIMTPSTHENIKYLTIDNPNLGDNKFLKFALYDADCNYVQLCFSVGKEDESLFNGNHTNISIDNKYVEELSIISRSTWKRKYVIYLFDKVTPNSRISFSYNNQTIVVE